MSFLDIGFSVIGKKVGSGHRLAVCHGFAQERQDTRRPHAIAIDTSQDFLCRARTAHPRQCRRTNSAAYRNAVFAPAPRGTPSGRAHRRHRAGQRAVHDRRTRRRPAADRPRQPGRLLSGSGLYQQRQRHRPADVRPGSGWMRCAARRARPWDKNTTGGTIDVISKPPSLAGSYIPTISADSRL